MSYSVLRFCAAVNIIADHDAMPFQGGEWLRKHLRVIIRENIYLQVESLYLFSVKTASALGLESAELEL